jgi:hypothetical protein
MFGPNGAGKSAVFDAVELLKVIVSDDWGPRGRTLKNLLSKWARNLGENNPPLSLGLGIQLHIDEKWRSDEIPYEMLSRLDLIHHYSMGLDGDYSDDFLDKNLRFFVNFKVIDQALDTWFISDMSISSDEKLVFELKHNVPKNYPMAYVHRRDWISFKEIDVLNQKYKDENYSGQIISKTAPTEIGFGATARSWFDKRYDENSELESAFIRLSQQIIDFVKTLISAELSDTTLVKASRTVPSITDAISVVPGEKWSGSDKKTPGYRLGWSPMLKNLEGTINRSETHWFSMCQMVARSVTSEADNLNKAWVDLNYLDRINSLLREELFIENGYQLTGEVFCLAPVVDIEQYDLEDASFYPKLVRLYLKDNHQRELEIEDVGSGIGYVLPVLAALINDGVALIQQPELHLHPRLQSQLGEAIIRAVENKQEYKAFTLIETHSEHILLKVMRLIRNANLRTNESLSIISFERVSILYFDPLPNGETQVKRLRLSPDGQLIDRWPGGFFNERFKDIFDE